MKRKNGKSWQASVNRVFYSIMYRFSMTGNSVQEAGPGNFSTPDIGLVS